jgi:ferrous iron transport protein A
MKNDFNTGTGIGPDVAAQPTSLADLAPGGVGVVLGVDREDAAGRRLLDLGLLPRTRVRALRRAPLGDPSLYEFRGYRLCLRRADARRVRVRVEQPDATAADPS